MTEVIASIPIVSLDRAGKIEIFHTEETSTVLVQFQMQHTEFLEDSNFFFRINISTLYISDERTWLYAVNRALGEVLTKYKEWLKNKREPLRSRREPFIVGQGLLAQMHHNYYYYFPSSDSLDTWIH